MLTIWLWSLLLIEFTGTQQLTILVSNRSLSSIATLNPLGEYESLSHTSHSVNNSAKRYMAIRFYELVHQLPASPKKKKKTKFPVLFPSHKVFVDPFGNRVTFSLGFSVNFQAALN